MRVLPPLCLLLATCLLGCPDPAEFEGTYREQTPITDESRDYAYVLDLFRFGDEVGGVVRFYELDGVSNRFDDPFRLESTCETFGSVTLENGTVRFSIPEGPTGETFTFNLSSVDPEDIDAEVVRTTNGQTNSTVVFDTDRVDTAADSECSPPPGAFEVGLDLPPITTAEAGNLSLAIAFAGYERNGDSVAVRRSAAEVLAVPRVNETTWSRSMAVPFPSSPPARALSDEGDGLQLSTGYLVLFDDADEDGSFVHNAVDDVVLAMSPDRVVVYVAGPPSGLSPDLRDTFGGGTSASVGYAVYGVDTTTSGPDAVVTQAVRLADGARITLERVSAANPVVYPVIVP